MDRGGVSNRNGLPKPLGCIAERMNEAAEGDIVLLVAEGEEGAYLGHVFVRWSSHYSPFRERDIPEIQDLNVITSVRRQGVASLLLDAAERRIATVQVSPESAWVCTPLTARRSGCMSSEDMFLTELEPSRRTTRWLLTALFELMRTSSCT